MTAAELGISDGFCSHLVARLASGCLDSNAGLLLGEQENLQFVFYGFVEKIIRNRQTKWCCGKR